MREDQDAMVHRDATPCSFAMNEGRVTDVKLQERITSGRAGRHTATQCVILIVHLRRHYANQAASQGDRASRESHVHV